MENSVDVVNHPNHYENSTSIECIDAMVLIFGREATYEWAKQTAFKYLWRYKNKNGDEDLNKAEWYINWCQDNWHSDYIDEQLVEISYMVNRAKERVRKHNHKYDTPIGYAEALNANSVK